MKRHKQLTQEQRYQIAILKAAGHLNNEIAELIGVSASTISREFARNGNDVGYDAEQANLKATQRKQNAAKATKMTAELIDLIEDKLRLDWSPEQISGWLERTQSIKISHERIYQHIREDKHNGGELYTHLRQAHKKRRKRYGSKTNQGQIIGRVSIEQRPEIVDEKTRIGDFEIDTVIGKNHQGALVTIVDRVSKFTLIKKVDSKHANGVAEATIALLQPYSPIVLTITSDNGKEFAGHTMISKALNADFYFAHPYSSWERGLNENTNGLIRQYFPKGSSFENINDEQIKSVEYRLNNRPRKNLNFRTPQEVFFEQLMPKAA